MLTFLKVYWLEMVAAVAAAALIADRNHIVDLRPSLRAAFAATATQTPISFSAGWRGRAASDVSLGDVNPAMASSPVGARSADSRPSCSSAQPLDKVPRRFGAAIGQRDRPGRLPQNVGVGSRTKTE